MHDDFDKGNKVSPCRFPQLQHSLHLEISLQVEEHLHQPLHLPYYYLSNRPQVSMVYKLIAHAGCW